MHWYKKAQIEIPEVETDFCMDTLEKKSSLKRLFHWTCNECGKEVTKEGYGLPKKWIWYGGTVKDPEVKHKCDECSSKN